MEGVSAVGVGQRLPDDPLMRGSDDFLAATTPSKGAQARMLGERKVSMLLSSTKGRARFALLPQAVVQCVAVTTAQGDGSAAMRRAMALCAHAESLRVRAGYLQEADAIFGSQERGGQVADSGRLSGCSVAAEGAGTGTGGSGMALQCLGMLEMLGTGGGAGSEAGAARQRVEELLAGPHERGHGLRSCPAQPPCSSGCQVTASWRGRGWKLGAGDQGGLRLVPVPGLGRGRREARGWRGRSRLWWFMTAVAWNASVRAMHGSGGVVVVG